jgi:hypothetical protein
MKLYESFEEIDQDLKKLNLERQIVIEELKLTQNQMKENLAPINWLDSIISLLVKYGASFLLNRVLRNR